NTPARAAFRIGTDHDRPPGKLRIVALFDIGEERIHVEMSDDTHGRRKSKCQSSNVQQNPKFKCQKEHSFDIGHLALIGHLDFDIGFIFYYTFPSAPIPPEYALAWRRPTLCAWRWD